MTQNVDRQTPERLLLSGKDVEAITGVDLRTITRHADAGIMPPGIKLGGLRRWRKAEIQEWIDAGCPKLRTFTAKGGAK